ncbi:class I SAM-dependent methyltransferase [Mycolicibacterium elephantis]
MNARFRVYQYIGRRLVAGWVQSEVLSILSALNSVQRAENSSGAVAEIGVHHGKLFIALDLLQREDEVSVAIDLFGRQELNIDKSGKGNLSAFRRNLRIWSPSSRVVIHQGDSTQLHPDELRSLARSEIRLFSVDGGHTASIVNSDMKLAEATIAQNGVVIADDVFHQHWPGVSTGTFRYLNEGGGLVPFAIGFNKVFFSKSVAAPHYREVLRQHFGQRFLLFVKDSEFAGHPVLVMGRVRRQPKALIGRSATARRIYERVQRR